MCLSFLDTGQFYSPFPMRSNAHAHRRAAAMVDKGAMLPARPCGACC